ncbi:hypothetical protein ABT160_06185 [Streptomyces sp. NPDC001941]|uniref:hypothetical protein n=1 Tax=Streptomyces sp. NPDC001941 TaxID=3154659 RepID=UPI0033322AA7
MTRTTDTTRVTEELALIGSDAPSRVLERDEEALLAPPHPGRLPVALWREQEPLTVAHFAQRHEQRPFAPPRGVFEHERLRVEWQTMHDERQPFYHRNCDVDELSYQIAGERTLLTELGVVEHRPGDLCRIPRGVAHDNYGRRESHLLFYSPAPVVAESPAVRTSGTPSPPFPGWRPGPVNEAVTTGMGAPGCDVAVFPVDEQLLLDRVHQGPERLDVLTAAGPEGLVWHYRGDGFRLGSAALPDADGRTYRRTLDADEVQYQISGHRTLVSQRGVVELVPGDLVRVPVGVAHTSFADGPSSHLVLLSARELRQVAPTDRTAEPCTAERLATLRKGRR